MYRPQLVLAGCLLCVIGASLTAAMTVPANDVTKAVQGDDVTIPELPANDVSNSIQIRKKRGEYMNINRGKIALIGFTKCK